MTEIRLIKSSTETTKLSSAAWVATATNTLIEKGIDAVQITRLAKELSVSRGSFYWHFADRQALLDAMIEAWQLSNSHAVKDAITKVDSLSEGILSFFSLWVDGTQFSPALEQAVRDWARLDRHVLKEVCAQDDRRIAAIARLYSRFGFARSEANVRARVLYFAQIGYFAMHKEESMEERMSMLELYYFSFTGQELEKSAAKVFLKKYRGKA